MVSFVILIGTLRVNLLFVLLFFGLVMLFSFIAAADAAIPSAATEADLAHILKLLQIGGGFGFIGLVCGWYVTYCCSRVCDMVKCLHVLHRYLAILEVCETVQIPCPLPVFDLSSKIFPAKKKSG